MPARPRACSRSRPRRARRASPARSRGWRRRWRRMSTSEPIAPDRLEALLRGEAGADGRERRLGALLDELTAGEIAPPAELRERVRSLGAGEPGTRRPR